MLTGTNRLIYIAQLLNFGYKMQSAKVYSWKQRESTCKSLAE